MRSQLDLTNIFPHIIKESEERNIERATIGNEVFPQYNKEAQQTLIDRFMERWGNAILHLLGELLPYKRHIEAINELKQHWITDDAEASLARDAVFEGVGMYWTLRSSDNYWRERVRDGLVSEREKPEIVKAWKIIETKGKDFKSLRAKYFLDSSKDTDVANSESFYNEVNTYACQVGAVMTLATIQNRHKTMSPMDLSKLLVKAWNAAMQGGPVASRNRMLLLSREAKWPMNMITKMDSPHAVYFRYFFLQLLAAEEAKAIWQGHLDAGKLKEMTELTRRIYFDYLVKEKAKGYKKTHPNWKKEKCHTKAHNDVQHEFAMSLSKWFDMPREDFDAWLEGRHESPNAEDFLGDEEHTEEETNTSSEEDELLEFIGSN
jgi:hypothetical protein